MFLISVLSAFSSGLAYAEVASPGNANQVETDERDESSTDDVEEPDSEDMINDEDIETDLDSETDLPNIEDEIEIATGSTANKNEMLAPVLMNQPKTVPENLDWEYYESNGKIIITRYLGTDTDVIIPEELDGFSVTDLTENVFSGKGITSVFMPDTIEKIGHSAFSGCDKLTDVTLSNNLTVLPSSTFFGCTSLFQIELPSSLKEIHISSFEETNIRNLYIPENVDSIIAKIAHTMPVSIENYIVDENNRYFSSLNGMLLNKNGDVFYLYPMGKLKDGDIIKLPDTVRTIKDLKALINTPYRFNVKYDMFLNKNIENIESLEYVSSPFYDNTWADPDSFIYRTFKINNLKINPTTESEFDEIMDSNFEIKFIDENSIEIFEYYGTNDVMNIPPYFGGIKVVAMANGAFYNEYVETIVIPNTLQTITPGMHEMPYEWSLDQCKKLHKIVNNSSIDIPLRYDYYSNSKGWYDQELSGGIKFDKIKANTITYKHYGINYGGIHTTEKYEALIDNYGYNEEIILPFPPYKSGYRFIGWYKPALWITNKTYITKIASGTNSNISIYADYEKISSGGSGGGGGGGGSSSKKSNTTSSAQNTPGLWKQDNKGWWFQKQDGSYPQNEWIMNNNIWYRFDPEGYMQTGWIEIDKIKYFLNPNGAMISNDWSLQDGKWYFFDSSGAMKTGWVNWKDKWYYLNSDGSMAVNITTPDGYTINSNGEWVQ